MIHRKSICVQRYASTLLNCRASVAQNFNILFNRKHQNYHLFSNAVLARETDVMNLRRTFVSKSTQHNNSSTDPIEVPIPPAMLPTFASLLSDTNLVHVKDERDMLTDLLKILYALDSPKDDIDLISDTKSRIDDLFMVVIVGEFNAGKSTFINALLGDKYLKDGVLPTTSKINLIRSSRKGDSTSSLWKRTSNMLLEDVEEMELPLAWLDNIAFIDTPGINAVISKHEELTQKIVPRADLILFVTSAERPITESESVFLSKISQWGKKVVVIVNKMDILLTESDKKQVENHVVQNVAKILIHEKSVPVFPVSSRHALNAKLSAHGIDPAFTVAAKFWLESNLVSVEEYLREVLGKEELIHSKLKNPLGIADRVITSALAQLESRSQLLEADLRILEMIDENMQIFNEDMLRDIKYYCQHIETILNKTVDKSDEFIETNVSLLNPSMMLNPLEFQKEFSRQVLSDLNQPIDETIADMSVVVAKRARQQARSVIEFVGTRPKRVASSMIGTIQETQFDTMRQEFVDRLQRDARSVLVRYDHKTGLKSMSDAVRKSFLQTVVMEVISAATVGGLVTMQMFDISGILAATTTALLGLLVVPWKKSVLRKDFETRVVTLRQNLDATIVKNFEMEMKQISERIMDTVTPYSRYVKMEQARIEDLTAKLLASKQRVHAIRKRVF